MLERGHRRPRPQVPDDERARRPRSPSSRRSCPALESPTVIPLAHAGHDRHPLGRRRGRGVGPAAAAQGGRRVGHPRPARSRRSSRDAPRPRGRRCRLAPPRPRRRRRRRPGRAAATHDALVRRGAVPDPAVRDGRPRRPSPTSARAATTAVRDANAAVGGGRAGRPPRPRRRDELRDARDAPRAARPRARSTRRSPTSAASPRPSARPRPRTDDRARHRDRAPLDAARPRRRLRPRRLGAVPVVAGHDRRPGPGRRRRAASSSPRPADRDGRTNPVLLGAAGLLEVDAFIVAGGAQAIGALAYGLPDAGIEPVDRIVGPGQRLGHRRQDRGLRRGRHRPAGRPVRGDGPGRRRRPIPHASPPTSSPRPSTGRTRRPSWSRPTPPSPTPSRPRSAVRSRGAAAATSSPPRSRDHGRIVLAPDARRRHRLRQRLRAPSTCRSTSSRSSRPSRACATPARCSSGRGRPSRPATTRPAPTTSCRPAAWPARPARWRSRPTASSSRSSASTATGLASIRDDDRDPGRGRGPARAPRRRRDPLRRRTGPDEPDAGHLQLADRARRPTAGRRPTRRSPPATASTRRAIVRFDLNTSPAPPALVERLLAAGRFEAPLSEYPPTDYRRLVEAAAARYGVDAGRDPGRRRRRRDPRHRAPRRSSRPAAGPSSRPRPTRCTGSSPSSAARPVVAVPRLGAGRGLGARRRPPSARPPATPTVVWLCSPNNPTALAEPDGAIAALLAGLADDAAAAGRPAPIVVLDEAYAEFVGASLLGLRDALPEPHRRPDREQGLRAGRAAGRVRGRPARDHRPAQPVPAARLGLDRVGHARHRGAPRPDDPRRQPRRGSRASGRACATALAAAGWSVGPSVTNFLLVDFGTAERAAAVAEALLRARPRAAHVRRRPPARRPPAPDRPRPATRTTDSSPPPRDARHEETPA